MFRFLLFLGALLLLVTGCSLLITPQGTVYIEVDWQQGRATPIPTMAPTNTPTLMCCPVKPTSFSGGI